MSNQSISMMLYYGGHPVATLRDIFQDQGTWFADYSLVPGLDSRINAFVEFNRRHLNTGDFDEAVLRSFAHLCESNEWHVEGPEGKRWIEGAPLFREADLSWVYHEQN